MSMLQGSKNKQSALAVPDTINLTTEERVQLIAHLIVDRIAEEEVNGFPLLKQIGKPYGVE